MIRMLYKEGRYSAVIICDHCQKRIEDYQLAAESVMSGNDKKDGELLEVFHVHKGECLDQMENKATAKGLRMGWSELRDHLLQVSMNVGLSPEKLLETDQRHKETGFYQL